MNDLFTLGETLRMAREHLKMSQADVAEATRMKVHIVDAIENNDFSRISVPLYGKGFIKLYAECVGLDPAPLIQDYLTRYARPVRPSLKSDHQPSAPSDHEPLPAMPSAKLASKRAMPDLRGLFDDVSHAVRERIERWVVAWARWRAASHQAAGGRPRRYRTSRGLSLPGGLWKPVAIAAGGLAVVLLLVYGGVRLAHRRPHPAAVAAAVVVPPPGPAKGPAPLRLAEEPPAPYLKSRLP